MRSMNQSRQTVRVEMRKPPEHFEPGDYVLHPHIEGLRGQVLWTEGRDVFVCWETGWDPYVRHNASTIKKVGVLDMLLEGREVEFEFTQPRSRCKCGLKLQPAKGGRKRVCSRCKVYYSNTGYMETPVHEEEEEA